MFAQPGRLHIDSEEAHLYCHFPRLVLHVGSAPEPAALQEVHLCPRVSEILISSIFGDVRA